MATSESKQPSEASARRPTVEELHALLYREIGISAVAAALSITGEAPEPRDHAKKRQPLPAILRELETAA
jgi:hypothetical protein